jgi:hypothetical protein
MKTAHDILAELQDKGVKGRIIKRGIAGLEAGDIVLSTAANGPRGGPPTSIQVFRADLLQDDPSMRSWDQGVH